MSRSCFALDYEPFDELLFTELQDLQMKVDDQLVRVAHLRSTMPDELEDLQRKILEAESKQLAALSDVPFAEPESLSLNVKSLAGLGDSLEQATSKVSSFMSVSRSVPHCRERFCLTFFPRRCHPWLTSLGALILS